MPANSGNILDVKQWPVIFFGFVLSCLILLVLRLGNGWIDKLDRVGDSMNTLSGDMKIFIKEQTYLTKEVEKLQNRATSAENRLSELERENERLKARLYRNGE